MRADSPHRLSREEGPLLGALNRAPSWGQDVLAFLRDWRAYRNDD